MVAIHNKDMEVTRNRATEVAMAAATNNSSVLRSPAAWAWQVEQLSVSAVV